MTITTNELGQTNIYAKEPKMYITEEDMARYEEQTYAEKAELLNSHWAMIGIVAGLLSYVFTGKLFFGIY